MRKTFALSHPKTKVARLVESIKHEVKKYIKRERNKKLPEGSDYWDFDCKFGNTSEEASEIHLTEINKRIDQAVEAGLESFYLEVMAKVASRHFERRDQAAPTPRTSAESVDADIDDEGDGLFSDYDQDIDADDDLG